MLFKLLLIFSVLQQVTVNAVPVTEQRSNADRHKDCSIIFNIDRDAPEKQPTLMDVSVSPMKDLMTQSAANQSIVESICNLIFAVQPTLQLGGQQKPKPGKPGRPIWPIRPGHPIRPVRPIRPVTDKVPTSSSSRPPPKPTTTAPIEGVLHEEDKDYDLTKPVYEQQLAIWPIEDIVEALDGATQTADTQVPTLLEEDILHPIEDAAIGHVDTQQQFPIYEDQLIVFPANIEDNNQQIHPNNNYYNQWATTTTTSTTVKPFPMENVEILQNVAKVHPNGTSEYLLVLSNGVVNYKKVHNKVINGQVVAVQEGYDSVPLVGQRDKIQTQYYISNENGHQVYKVEQSQRYPQAPLAKI